MDDTSAGDRIWVRTFAAPTLTEGELAVIRLVAAGRRRGEAAAELYLAIDTIDWYLVRIRDKLGAQTTAQAAVIAVRSGLIE